LKLKTTGKHFIFLRAYNFAVKNHSDTTVLMAILGFLGLPMITQMSPCL